MAKNRSPNHAYPQFPLKAQCRLTVPPTIHRDSFQKRACNGTSKLTVAKATPWELPASHTPHPLKSTASFGNEDVENQTRCVDAKRYHMECNSRCVFDPRKDSVHFTFCKSRNLSAGLLVVWQELLRNPLVSSHSHMSSKPCPEKSNTSTAKNPLEPIQLEPKLLRLGW